MRTTSRTNQFKKDFRREQSGRWRGKLDGLLLDVLRVLASDGVLADRYRDHALVGHWAEHRDCHLKPDLVLIYRKPDENTLDLVRLGSHSELGW